MSIASRILNTLAAIRAIFGADYQIVIDAWEEQEFADLQMLKDNGVAGVLLRLNDINGGTHVDTGFPVAWDQAGGAGLLRAPYFVYNPWLSGGDNYNWLSSHVPQCGLVAADIEVTKTGYSRSQYGAEVKSFMGLVDARWNRLLYTGQWFLQYLSSWPGGNYWWAAYPDAMYPGVSEWTYDQLKQVMDTLTTPSNLYSIPGVLKLWQVSGDRIILPGSGGHPVDINLFRGSLSELATLFGDSGVVVQPEPKVYAIKRSLADYDICFTQGSGELPLLSAVEHAELNGWECAMNGGAGFDYTDATHAVPRIVGFEQVNGIPFARRMITAGQINPDLDNTYRAPWSMLGFDVDGNVYLVVTCGQEGVSGNTQAEAAIWATGGNIRDLYLMDSGHSSQIAENGQMLYWPYGIGNLPAPERVPQAIGLRKKGASMAYQAQEKLGKTVTVRTSPQAISGNGTNISILPYAVVDYVKIVDDVQHPGDANYRWLQLNDAGTQFANYFYPSATVPSYERFTLITQPTPPPPPPSAPYHVELVDNVTGEKWAGDLAKVA